MSGVITKIFGGGATDLVKGISEALDPFFTSKEEKAKANLKVTALVSEWQVKMESTLTERLKIDMTSDSWLSKNIRPMVLIYILVVYTAFSLSDGNISLGTYHFKINSEYVELMGEWGKSIMYFYFGGRTLEKVVSAFKSKSNG